MALCHQQHTTGMLAGPHSKHQAISLSTKSPILGAQGFVYIKEAAGIAFENHIILQSYFRRALRQIVL